MAEARDAITLMDCSSSIQKKDRPALFVRQTAITTGCLFASSPLPTLTIASIHRWHLIL